MTPEEYALAAACGACTHHKPCMERRADLFRAAFRERDAAHEVALKKARTDALNAAARLCAKKAEEIKHTRHVDGIGMGWQAGEALALQLDLAIRALLEEAGK